MYFNWLTFNSTCIVCKSLLIIDISQKIYEEANHQHNQMNFQINDALIGLINEKGKQHNDVTGVTLEVFTLTKKVLLYLEKSLKQNIADTRIKIQFKDSGTFEAQLFIGDDILIFLMHTNAFIFESSNAINNSGYIKEDNTRAMCGIISIYNFLSDSFKYERKNDVGYLIARIFVNREKHFIVEGKKQFGLLFNDFPNNVINEENLLTIVENAIQFSINIDPVVPPFESMKEISVDMAIEYSLQASISSGKRLGFKFEKDIGDSDIH